MDADDRKSHRVTTRYTQAERERLLLKAAKAGMSESAYVRAASLGRKVEAREQTDPDFELVNQLRKIGNNLNQIAHIANRNKRVPAGLPELMDELTTVLMSRINR